MLGYVFYYDDEEDDDDHNEDMIMMIMIIVLMGVINDYDVDPSFESPCHECNRFKYDDYFNDEEEDDVDDNDFEDGHDHDYDVDTSFEPPINWAYISSSSLQETSRPSGGLFQWLTLCLCPQIYLLEGLWNVFSFFSDQ